MLQMSGVKKSYGSNQVLHGVDLHVKRGEIVVIMGPSGCGKSTLIRCINRLIEPNDGDILVDGQLVLQMNNEELRLLRRHIGFVFQHFHLIQRLTAWQNVALGEVSFGVSTEEAKEKALAALEQVGLKSYAHRLPEELSGGQQQRVGIARALITRPKIMLWDEPTASLDPIRVQEVLDVMEQLVEQTDTTMLIVTHEVPFALRMADRIVLMDGGRIVEQGDPIRLFTNPTSSIGRQYARLAHWRHIQLPKNGRKTPLNAEEGLELGAN